MNILFAFVSIIMIYPIIYKLPIRFSAKQKFILLIISLLISLFGILSKNVIPFWQTALLMFALIGLTSMLISKRMPETIQSEPTSHNDFVIYNTNETNDFPQHLNEINFNKPKEMIFEGKMDDVEDPIIELSPIEESIEPLISEHLSDFFLEKEDMNMPEYDQLYEVLNADLFVTVTTALDEELDEIEMKTEEVDTNQRKSSQYLSDIEKLLIEEEIAPTINETSTKNSSLKEIKLEKLF